MTKKSQAEHYSLPDMLSVWAGAIALTGVIWVGLIHVVGDVVRVLL